MMNSRERIRTIIAGENPDRCGFWLGNPHADTWPIYHAYFGTTSEEEVRLLLGDDFRWIMAGTYGHPEGKAPFAVEKTSHGTPGPLAHCQDAGALDDLYDWPSADNLDFTASLTRLENTGAYYRASGFWTPF
ncbi:MAG: hypothetical protein P1S60_05845, partial [Anaerolineae bacterium]|nr:hypothetical protein [Anaerolineae bacterium]